MKILIVDNEAPLRQILKKMLLYRFEQLEVTEASGVHEGIKCIFEIKPDIVFLDIEMDDGTGFDLLAQISNRSFQLIFTTAYNQYAIRAFRFSALDYLLKPIDPALLYESVQKAQSRIQEKNINAQVEVLLHQMKPANKDKKIVLKDADAAYFVKVSDIICCEAQGPYTRFYIENMQAIIISKNLKEFEILLEPEGFIRIHHATLINRSKVIKFNKTDGGSLLLSNGLNMPVSQRKKDYVLKLLEER